MILTCETCGTDGVDPTLYCINRDEANWDCDDSECGALNFYTY